MYYMTSITSTAQWSTRRNQMIFAVLDVSWTTGINSDKTFKVFCINICCYSTRFYFLCTTVAQSSKYHHNCGRFWSRHSIKPERSLCVSSNDQYQGNGFAAEVLRGHDHPRVVPIGPIVRGVIAFPILGTWRDATTQVASQSVHW